MAAVIAPSPIYKEFAAPGDEWATNDAQWSRPPLGYLVEQLLIPSVHNITQPVNANGYNISAIRCPGYVDDWYGRIHVTPKIIELGNITSGQVRTFDVWNAYIGLSKTLQSIDVDGDDTGIILTEPDATPSTYLPLQLKTYQLDFFTNGPALISVIYNLNFTAETISVDVSGRRAILFSFIPNWDKKLTEKLSWLTNILESENGTEYRQKLRTNPRRSYKFSVLLNLEDKKLLNSYLFGWKSNVFILPAWVDCGFTTSLTALGATTINLDTLYKEYVGGGLAVLIADAFTNEIVEIQNVNPTSITLSRATSAEWPAGTRIYPAFSSRLSDSAKVEQPTEEIIEASFDFDIVKNKAISGVDGSTLHQGVSVLDEEPNRLDDLEVDYETKTVRTDFSITEPGVSDLSGFPDIIGQALFTINTKKSLWEWREWFHARAGRFKKFFMPTWSVDLTVLIDIQDTDVAITVNDLQYRDFYNLHETKRDIMIVSPQGIFFRRITSVTTTATPGEELMGIDTPLGVLVPAATIERVTFVTPVRLDSDEVVFEWESVNVANVDIETRSIIQ